MSAGRAPALPERLWPWTGREIAGWFSDVLLAAAVILLFAVSGNALFVLGFHYEASGGGALEKFHPATPVAVAALTLRLAVLPPREAIARTIGRYPGFAVLSAACAFAILYIVLALKVPVTPVAQTFLLPLILFAAFALRQGAPRGLAPLIHLAFSVNALLGLAEFLGGFRLTPFVAGTVVITDDWRSTALFGHPLGNASLTAAYVVILTFGPRGVPVGWRLPMIALQTAALVPFGGRTSLVLTFAFLLLAAGYQMLRFLAGARLRLTGLAHGILGLPLIAIVVAGLVQTGFFDRLAERFVSDEGSARTRILMFKLFESLSAHDLLIGPDPEIIGTLVRREGLEFGIESFPVAMVLMYGAAAAGFLLVGLVLFCADLVRATRPATAFALGLFLVIGATSTSLASKTTMLGMMTVMILTMMPPEQPRPAPS